MSEKYQMFKHKDLNFGFVVLCHNHDTSLVKLTVRTIHRSYGEEIPLICVADNSVNKDDMKELKEICPSYKGKDSWSSLINVGMKRAKAEWNFIIVAGTVVKRGLDTSFSFFLGDEKDIMFPIAEGKTDFVDGTLNGLFMNKKFYKEVGDMATENPLDICKLMWALEAIEKGAQFKAILGTKMI
jgi:hypothetical protein